MHGSTVCILHERKSQLNHGRFLFWKTQFHLYYFIIVNNNKYYLIIFIVINNAKSLKIIILDNNNIQC